MSGFLFQLFRPDGARRDWKDCGDMGRAGIDMGKDGWERKIWISGRC